IPRGHARISRGEQRVGRGDAESLLLLQSLPPDHVPAVVVLASVAAQEVVRRLMRRMGGTEREIHEEWRGSSDSYLIREERNGVIDEVLVEGVALVGGAWRVDAVIVVHEVGRE